MRLHAPDSMASVVAQMGMAQILLTAIITEGGKPSMVVIVDLKAECLLRWRRTGVVELIKEGAFTSGMPLERVKIRNVGIHGPPVYIRLGPSEPVARHWG